MKAVAAIAISNHFSQAATASAGLFVAIVIGVCSITGLLGWLGRAVPIPVIKGIQVGAGLSLVLSAGTTFFSKLRFDSPEELDNHWWTIFAFIFLLVTTSPTNTVFSKIPYALSIFLIGLLMADIRYYYDRPSYTGPSFSIWRPSVVSFTTNEVLQGAFDAGIGQLPLTALNSIIAVTHLSAELLPTVPTPSERSIGFSVAIMNLVSCPFGAMPTCHGSGGLAAQFKFGARSGSSIIMLGMLKLTLGLICNDNWLFELLDHFPKSFLGIMVCAAGVELASVGASLNSGAKDLWQAADEEDDGKRLREPEEKERKERWMVMMITVAGILAFRNDAVGFLAGLACHASLRGPAWWEARKQRKNASGNGGSQEEREGLLGGERSV